MKKIITATALLFSIGFMAGVARAADTSLFNIGDMLDGMRAGYAINQHMERSTVFYKPFYSYHSAAGIEYINLDIGYDGTLRRPMIAGGLRLDNLNTLICSGSWGKAHISVAKIPTFEFGPYVSAWPIKTDHGYAIDMYYGVVAALGFSVNGGKQP